MGQGEEMYRGNTS